MEGHVHARPASAIARDGDVLNAARLTARTAAAPVIVEAHLTRRAMLDVPWGAR